MKSQGKIGHYGRNLVCILFLLLTNTFVCLAQSNFSLAVNAHQTPILAGTDRFLTQPKIKLQPPKISNPRKATLLSAVLPGAGQFYNKKYWKIGVLYAAAGGLAYFYKYNADSLKRYQKAYSARIDGDSNTVDIWYPRLTENGIKSGRDFHRRNRDVSIVGMVVLYTLNIIDASVDAHLKEFEINKDLSLKISPDFNYNFPRQTFNSGLTLSFRF